MKKDWSYFQNPFLNAGKTFKKALALSNYTNAQLLTRQADPFYGPLFTTFTPLDKALTIAYNTWKSMGGSQKGATLSVDQLLKLLSPGKINTWDYAVTGVYAKGTPQYVAIFPGGHKPFQHGEINQRIETVNQLAIALNGILPLAATLTDVQNFYAQLTTARDTQQGSKGTTGSNSDEVKAAAEAAMTGLYSILGSCITRFNSDPTQAQFLFDMELLRHHDQVIFTGTLHGAENHVVLKHTFGEADTIMLENTGATQVTFYLSANASDGPGKASVTLTADETNTVPITALGDIADKFLHVINVDLLAEGSFKVEL